MTSDSQNGIVLIPSHQSVDETVEKLEAILQAKEVKLFALIDHSGEAKKAGIEMCPTKLLIFGNPKAGTPLMIASPGIAIDLPLKVLVSEDVDGKGLGSHTTPQLTSRRGMPCRGNSSRILRWSRRWQERRSSKKGVRVRTWQPLGPWCSFGRRKRLRHIAGINVLCRQVGQALPPANVFGCMSRRGPECHPNATAIV